MKKFFLFVLLLVTVFSFGIQDEAITAGSDKHNKHRPNIPTLKAGAGSSPIVFPAEMFDPSLPNIDGFNGVTHDNPYMRVLVLERDIKVAIVSAELVNIPAYAITLCKDVVSEKTGTLPENVWVHATHAITTPHAPGNPSTRRKTMKYRLLITTMPYLTRSLMQQSRQQILFRKLKRDSEPDTAT